MAYNDLEDRTMKEYTHMILALAYITLDDISRAFTELRNDVPDELLHVMDYFRTTYINSRLARD